MGVLLKLRSWHVGFFVINLQWKLLPKSYDTIKAGTVGSTILDLPERQASLPRTPQFLRGVFFKTPRKNTPDLKVYGLLFSHFITWVKKVRGVFKINATSSLNFEISRQLSDLLLSTLRLTWMENAVAFSIQPCYVSDFDMCSDGFFPLMAILIHNFWESTLRS